MHFFYDVGAEVQRQNWKQKQSRNMKHNVPFADKISFPNRAVEVQRLEQIAASGNGNREVGAWILHRFMICATACAQR